MKPGRSGEQVPQRTPGCPPPMCHTAPASPRASAEAHPPAKPPLTPDQSRASGPVPFGLVCLRGRWGDLHTLVYLFEKRLILTLVWNLMREQTVLLSLPCTPKPAQYLDRV